MPLDRPSARRASWTAGRGLSARAAVPSRSGRCSSRPRARPRIGSSARSSRCTRAAASAPAGAGSGASPATIRIELPAARGEGGLLPRSLPGVPRRSGLQPAGSGPAGSGAETTIAPAATCRVEQLRHPPCRDDESSRSPAIGDGPDRSPTPSREPDERIIDRSRFSTASPDGRAGACRGRARPRRGPVPRRAGRVRRWPCRCSRRHWRHGRMTWRPGRPRGSPSASSAGGGGAGRLPDGPGPGAGPGIRADGAAYLAAQAGRREDAIAYWRRDIAISPWRSDYHAELALSTSTAATGTGPPRRAGRPSASTPPTSRSGSCWSGPISAWETSGPPVPNSRSCWDSIPPTECPVAVVRLPAPARFTLTLGTNPDPVVGEHGAPGRLAPGHVAAGAALRRGPRAEPLLRP